MNFATSTIMPLLTRFVIAAAMLTSGWANCFEQIEIRPAMAEGLLSNEIEVLEAETSEPVLVDGEEALAIGSNQAQYTTRGVNRMVWLIHDKWPDLGSWSVLLAWAAAVGQLLAGVLLIVGLFTRLAALTVCLATGAAIYIVSGDIHGMFSMNPFDWPQDSHRFIQLFAGLGVFTLSLGLVFGGGGGLAMDNRYANSAPVKSKGAPRKRVPVDVEE